MDKKTFYNKCFECERQLVYEINGVKDNYYKCRISNLVNKELFKETMCPYYKQKEVNK